MEFATWTPRKNKYRNNKIIIIFYFNGSPTEWAFLTNISHSTQTVLIPHNKSSKKQIQVLLFPNLFGPCFLFWGGRCPGKVGQFLAICPACWHKKHTPTKGLGGCCPIKKGGGWWLKLGGPKVTGWLGANIPKPPPKNCCGGGGKIYLWNHTLSSLQFLHSPAMRLTSQVRS